MAGLSRKERDSRVLGVGDWREARIRVRVFGKEGFRV